MPTVNSTTNLLDRAWRDVLAWLPADLDALASSTGALQKRRAIRTGAQLLRIVFAYAVLDLSLRSTAAWARAQGVAEMSDVAVLKRLTASAPFLEALLARLFTAHVRFPSARALPWRVRLTDSTTVSHPGSTGADWRVHVGYDAERRCVDAVELTDGTGGEHLERIAPKAGDLLVADRGYAHADRILKVQKLGAHVLVRVGHRAVPMWTVGGEPFDPLAYACRKRAKAGRPPRVEEAAVELRGNEGKTCIARLIIVRKSVEATERERNRIRREASRKGKSPTTRTLRAAAFTFLLTTVPAKEASAAVLAELYRVRWQIELAFKRWKSLLDLDELRARDPDLARTYLLGKLVAAQLADIIARTERDFSPWGVPLEGTAEPLAVVPLGL